MKNKMKKTKKVVLFASLIMETKTKLNTGQEVSFGNDDIFGVMYVFKSKELAEKIYGKGCPLIQIGMRPQEREEIKKIQNEKLDIDIKSKEVQDDKEDKTDVQEGCKQIIRGCPEQ